MKWAKFTVHPEPDYASRAGWQARAAGSGSHLGVGAERLGRLGLGLANPRARIHAWGVSSVGQSRGLI